MQLHLIYQVSFFLELIAMNLMDFLKVDRFERFLFIHWFFTLFLV
jgi:hypothetical protein